VVPADSEAPDVTEITLAEWTDENGQLSRVLIVQDPIVVPGLPELSVRRNTVAEFGPLLEKSSKKIGILIRPNCPLAVATNPIANSR